MKKKKPKTEFCYCNTEDPTCTDCWKPIALFCNHAGPRSMSGIPMEHDVTSFKKGGKYYALSMCEVIFEGAANEKGKGRFRITGNAVGEGSMVILPKREVHS